MPPKRKDDLGDDLEPKKIKISQLAEWKEQPPSLIYRVPRGQPMSNKIAAFDLDGTLVNLEGGLAPVSAEDMFKANVPTVMRGLYNDGYKLVIFANEGSIRTKLDSRGASKIKTRYDDIIDALDLPISLYIATDKGLFFKPMAGMWDFMCAHHLGGMPPDRANSFYVGCNAGREGDASADDKEFAQRCGIPFKTPEDCFGQHVNADLCACFDVLARDALSSGDKYESRAFKKVSAELARMPGAIKSGKEVAHIQGIGKKSVALIDEWISTGKMQAVVDIETAEAANAEEDSEEEEEEPDAGEDEDADVDDEL